MPTLAQASLDAGGRLGGGTEAAHGFAACYARRQPPVCTGTQTTTDR
jgi:hypothetical protein